MTRTAALGALLILTGCASMETAPRPASAANQAADQAAIAAVLDRLHAAAAAADGRAYFDLYTPDAVFIGTDATERWTLPEFRAYAEPIFSQGRGWTYRPRSRQIILGPDGRTAWFDELLDSESYGTSRGTGVLLQTPEGWRVAHYALSFPIPNDLARDITARIRAHEAQAAPR